MPRAAEAEDLVRELGKDAAGFVWLLPRDAAFPAAAAHGRFRQLGRPYWLSGLPATAANVARAVRAGATGLMVSTPFHYCAESELAPDLKTTVLDRGRQAPAHLDVKFLSSPTGFAVPVVQLEGSAADPREFSRRTRFCDVGYLRQIYRTPQGDFGYRCPGETLSSHLAKGGDPCTASSQHCLCNGILAALGLGQVRLPGYAEPPLVPAGEDVSVLGEFAKHPHQEAFTAAEVIASLLATLPTPPVSAAPETAHGSQG